MKKYTGLVKAEEKLLKETEEKIVKKLEQEKLADIPSIPDSLKPENIGRLLEKKPEKKTMNDRINWRGFYMAAGGMAAAIAIFFAASVPSMMGGRSGSDSSANGAVMEREQEAMFDTKAASAAVTEDIEAELRPTGSSPLSDSVTGNGVAGNADTEHKGDGAIGPDMGVSATPETSVSVTQEQEMGAETEAGALEYTEGDYVAACVEGDILYVLQKTETYELYIVNLADTSEWEKINPVIPEDAEIIELKWKDSTLYAVDEQGREYACQVEN